MKLFLMTILCSILSATAFAKGTMDKGAMKKDAMSNAFFMDAKDIKFEAQEGFPGSYTWFAEGDPKKGAHHAFHKFDAGFSAPLHHHTADYYGTVVKGTVILGVDGTEHRLGPGSFFSFKKKAPHTTTCAEGSECIISLDTRGKWDIVPEKKLVQVND